MITVDGSWIYAVLGMILGIVAFLVGMIAGAIWAWWRLSR